MSRTILPFAAEDVSSLARFLNRELAACTHKPGHVQLLNMLTRAIGYQNFQHFRAQFAARSRLEREAVAADPVDYLRVERVAGHFDAQARMVRWPSKPSHQVLCLWVLWSRIPSGRVFSEAQINEILRANHLFGDHALLRRDLFGNKLVARTVDCREYQRIERRPPAEAVALIRHLGARLAG